MAVPVGRRLDAGFPNYLLCPGQAYHADCWGGVRTRRIGGGAPPHARPFECLRVSGPSDPGRVSGLIQDNHEGLPLPGRGWISARGPEWWVGGEGIASELNQALRYGSLTTLARPT